MTACKPSSEMFIDQCIEKAVTCNKLSLYDSLSVISFSISCMDTPACFSAIFAKGNNFCDFLFASQGMITLPK